jgi:glucan phosphoethanolaminetransferase (alkaline phosphatase superfamily)
MTKKQKYALIIFLSFIFLFIITSIFSYQKNTYYHNLNGNYYLSITQKYIQPFYNTVALYIWFAGIFFLILFTYFYFRNYNDPVYKKYLVDYKLLFKSLVLFIIFLFSIGIFGEFYPSFYLGEDEISFITETEFRENTNTFDISVDEFNKEYWAEI